MTLLYILAALLMLGVMVTVHEAGHFFAARLCRIPVREFAIGFGPKLLNWGSKKHETKFSLRLIPAGGFCSFYGEDDPSADKADPRALNNHAVWKRMLTILMGPVMNIVLALVVAFGFYALGGLSTGEYGRAQVTAVTEGSAAEAAGFQVGDYIETISGQDARGLTDDQSNYKVSQLISAYKEGDAPLTVTVTRDGEETELTVTPLYDESQGRYMVGISMSMEIVNQQPYYPGFLNSVKMAFNLCLEEGTAILDSFRQLFSGEVGLDQASGPVGVITLVAEQTKEYGLEGYLSLLIFISVNLGLVNLLPIPGLDGSRLVFLLIEGIRRKPVPQKIEAYIHLAGFALLMILFLFLTVQDVGKLF